VFTNTITIDHISLDYITGRRSGSGSDSGYQQRNIPSHERYALYDLYTATYGYNWVYQDGDEGHWNFTNPDVNPCSSTNRWQGLNCTVISSDSSSNYYISGIMLSEYNLRGSIPNSIGNYSSALLLFIHSLLSILYYTINL
jgi:hypothetical protein